jgi:hypothetical protein
MSILEEMLEMFATTVQAELSATLMNSLRYSHFFGSSTEGITLYLHGVQKENLAFTVHLFLKILLR